MVGHNKLKFWPKINIVVKGNYCILSMQLMLQGMCYSHFGNGVLNSSINALLENPLLKRGVHIPWGNDSLSKSGKSIFYVKKYPIYLIFFSIKDNSLGAHFL